MHREGWEKVRLGDVCNIVMGQSPKSKYYTDDILDMPFFQGCTEFGDIYPEVRKYCSQPKKTVRKGDLLMSVRAPVGAINIAPFECSIGRGLCGMRGKENVSQRFLYYLLTFNRESLEEQGGGSVYNSINKKSLLGFEIFLPPLSTQKKIASILSKYDDLIENNTRRIEILEEQAQALYRQRFIEYKFPGHENVEMIDSGTEFGKIPEGWEVKKIGKIGEIITGKTPSTKKEEFRGKEMMFIKTPDMHGNIFCLETSMYLSEKGYLSQKNKTLPSYSVLVSCIGTLGVVSLTTEESHFNQQINAVIPNDLNDTEFIYLNMKTQKSHLENLGSNGATMGNVNKGKFESIKIVYPDDSLLEDFHFICKGLFDEILNLQKQNKNLKKQRDILLPKLINGDILVD